MQRTQSEDQNMRRESWSIVFACALGACIGTLAALDISTRFQYGSYLWGIGALFGGVVVCVAVDFRHFCAGVAHSYRKTIAWRPNGLYWRAWLASWVLVCAIVATSLIFVGMIPISVCLLDGTVPPITLNGFLSVSYYGLVYVWPGMSLTMGTWMAFAPLGRRDFHKTNADYEDFLRRQIAEGWSMALNVNPIGIIFWSLWGIVWGLKHSPDFIAVVATFVAAGTVVLWQFVAGVFIYVHSERRTLCFVDATVGAAIGYSFGSAIIGAIAGAILGIINYELVSVRWLKLANAQTPTT